MSQLSDEKCWLQITSGSGPIECALAVAKLVPTLRKAAQNQGLEACLIDAVQGREKHTLVSALLSVSGHKAQDFATGWQGTHQWICQSPFRPHHKRKNWFIGVNLLAVPEQHDNKIKPSDLSVQTCRSSGPGGQHANKTDSAVRLIHKPTGIVINAQEERSQHMNKKLALGRLFSMLENLVEARQADLDFTRWMKHKELERGNPVRVFEGKAFTEKNNLA